ncbi:MAG: helix-turn-helix transcriptional regulator [Steroidobacteraceae bacterium]
MPTPARNLIVGELKRALRAQGLTYADVAKVLCVSVASVKRLFSTGDFSLERVDRICELAGCDLADLLERARGRTTPANQLTLTQEQQIVADPRLLLVTWLLINRAPLETIVRDYAFTEREVLRYFIQLDRLKVIELQPGNRVRLLVSRHFSWRAGGPVQRYIHEKLLKEFLSSNFTGPNEEFYFHGGELSEDAIAQIRRALGSAARECAEIVDRQRPENASRRGAAFVLALRPWSFSGFRQFERVAERVPGQGSR